MLMPDTRYITALRFPLALLVVLIHTYNSDWRRLTDGAFPMVADFLSHVVPSFAVSLFFAVSGYLFFLRVRSFTPAVYAEKLRRRALTLLLPYVVWNFCAFCLYAAQDMAGGQSFALPLSPDLLWGCRELSAASVGIAGLPVGAVSAPVLLPLWFVRDLMLAVLLSPLVWWLLRRLGAVVPLLLGVACHLDLWPNFCGVSLSGLFFFSLGAAFSVPRGGSAAGGQRDVIAATRLLFVPALVAVPLTLGLKVLCPDGTPFVTGVSQPLYVFSAMIVAVHAADRLTRRRVPSALLAGSSFFLYAAHAIVLRPITRVVSGWALERNFAVQVALYLGCAAAAVGICLLAYAVISRWCPRLGAPFTGQFGK